MGKLSNGELRIENGELDSYIRHNEDKCQFESEVSETDSSHSFTSTSLRIQAHKFQQASTVRFVTMTTNNSQLSILHSQFKNAAFTLAEVIVTLTILGVVAALTVPSIVHNNQTRINKTRLKKAMATYDRAISQMSVVNRLNNKVLFKQWAEEDKCNNAISYFNIVNSTRNGCKFKTSDGIWWDVSEIDRTIVSFKEENLTLQKAKDYDDKDAFVLVTSFEDTQGTLRIDDLGYETINDINNSYTYVAKLYQFLGIIEKILSEFTRKCISVDETHCKIGNYTYEKVTLTAQSVTKAGINNSGSNICVWDRDANPPAQVCGGFESKVNAGDIAYFVDMGTITPEDLQNQEGKISSYTNDYWQAAMNKCTNGTHLATLAELKALKDIGKLSSGMYWSSNENSTSTAYLFTATNGNVYHDGKYTNVLKVVCVGN